MQYGKTILMSTLLAASVATPLALAGMNDLAGAAAALSGQAEPSGNEAAGGISGGLVDMAMGQLGLSQSQAAGGLGSLFGLAQENLDAGEFAQISDAVPSMRSLLAAAPALGGGKTGGLGGLVGTVTSLAGSSQILQQFDSLGLSADTIGPLVNLVVEYLGNQEGGANLGSLFQKGLGNLLG